MPEVVAIAAVGRNGVIGSGGDIPWRIPEDWRRFKAITTGQLLIMGRKTFDSIGRPLPGRTTIVVTRDRKWRREGVTVAATLQEAFDQARAADPETIYVAGGGEIYRSSWDLLDRLEITEVQREPTGEVTFPEIDPREWRETGREDRDGYSFVSYSRAEPLS